MQTRATIIYNTSNEPQYVVCMNYVIGQDEGRRHLMMEQEDLKDTDLPKGVIDVTSLSSPGPAHSSGYCSADEDHSYSSSKGSAGGTPGLDGCSTPTSPLALGTPGTPPNLPLTSNHLPDLTDDLSLFDMLGEMLPPQTSSALGGGQSSESWMAGLDTDIEMLDMDQGGLDPSATDGDGLLVNLLKDTEKQLADLQQAKLGPEPATFGVSQSMMGVTPATSAVITQSNVMLSSATFQSSQQAESTAAKAGMTQMVTSGLDNQTASLPLSLGSGLTMPNSKANVSVAAFPPGMLGVSTDADNNIADSTNDFALKYAENVVDQQINATLANYFGCGDTLMDSSDLGVQDTPMNGLSDLLLEDSSTLSSFLTGSTPTPTSSAPSQPSCSAYQPRASVGGSKPLATVHSKPTTTAQSKSDGLFVVPKGLPPVSSHSITVNGHSARNANTHHHHNHHNHNHHRSHSSANNNKVLVPPRQQSSSSSSSHRSSSQQHYPGLDDHRYTNKQLDSPPHKGSASNSSRHHKSSSYRQPVSQLPNHPSSHPLLLEKFLLTKEKLNPNKGSEAALATKAISELHLGDHGDGLSLSDAMMADGNQQLLKKLLTEEIHPKDLAKAQQEVIQDRRLSAGSASPPAERLGSATDLEPFSLDTDDLTQSIQLLGDDTNAEMDKVWAPPGGDITIPSELDDILQEEMRQNDLWLQHCINELL